MEDTEIMELFWARNEDAIKETDAVYGRRLNALAKNILQSREDAEESVKDDAEIMEGTFDPDDEDEEVTLPVEEEDE